MFKKLKNKYQIQSELFLEREESKVPFMEATHLLQQQESLNFFSLTKAQFK